MAKEKITTTLKKDKDCKSCVRFRSSKGQDDKVTTSLYVQNEGHEKLGSPDTIKVSVEAG